MVNSDGISRLNYLSALPPPLHPVTAILKIASAGFQINSGRFYKFVSLFFIFAADAQADDEI